MNLDRLLKLLKLANHNPNDAEANSAARAVCKILGEENYKWIESVKKGVPVAEPVGATGRTWNDVHRTTEPFWRSTRPPPPRNPSTGEPFNPFWDRQPFSGFDWDVKWWQEQYAKMEEEARKDRERRKEENRKKKEAQAQNWTWNGERSGDKGYKKVYTQKCRDCTACGITRLTTDEDTPYVCYSCKMKV